MAKVSIISIGNEILNGDTTDTNATYLSKNLLAIGLPVLSSYTVPDNIDSIVRSLKLACDDADIVLVTGGLGPTDDDLTRQGIAEFLGVELELRDELLEKIEKFFAGRNIQMSAKNKIQAYLPAGTTPLPNDYGTAPGIGACWGGKKLFAMPGVPSEMKRMFEDSVLGQLKSLNTDRSVVVVRKLKCFGTGESTLAEQLGDLMRRGRNPQINCTVHYGIITLHIVATAKSRDEAWQMIEESEKLLREKLGRLIYGVDEQSLAEVLGQKLIKENKTIAVAESCTGGLLGKLITDVAGASKYFTYGWITYSNDAKISQLGVPVELIEKYGAVSPQVAEAMAVNARKMACSDYAVAITGIAGPGGGTAEKPVGLVYICVDSAGGCQTKRFIFSHDRQFVRLRTAQAALNMLRSMQ